MTINVFQPSLGAPELAAVAKVFRSNWIGKGKKTSEFEHKFADHLKVPNNHVLSISSCTSGLFNVMRLIGVSTGMNVIMPSISFVGSANAVVARGASVRFCDVDPHTLNPNVEHIDAARDINTAAVVILHYGGYPCQMDKISKYCLDNGLYLIEDSACSISSSYDGKICGTWGDFGLWSFDAMKILCTGDGGMMYVADTEMAERARKMCYLGLSSGSGMSSVDPRWWEFEVNEAGDRSIMNDMQSAIGLVQLSRLPSFIASRALIHNLYDVGLSEIPQEVLRLPPGREPHQSLSYYFYWVQTERRDDLAHHLRENGVYTTFRYYPLHKVKFYQHYGPSLPGADYAADHTLNLPIHQSLTNEDVDKICGLIKGFYNA